MIFKNVFGYQKDSEQIKTLNAYENNLGILIGDYFGLNPKEAKKKVYKVLNNISNS